MVFRISLKLVPHLVLKILSEIITEHNDRSTFTFLVCGSLQKNMLGKMPNQSMLK